MLFVVTGGTGLVGVALVRAILRAGHRVRVIVRNTPDPGTIDDPLLRQAEYRAGNVADRMTIRGAFDDADVVVHAAGIAREVRPHGTFRRVNVEGTRHVMWECALAEYPHLVMVSSLGADRGRSRYHASKRHAERLVHTYAGPWTIVRPGNVYGAEGGELALFLELMRLLPIVPVVGDPDTRFQPVASADLAQAIVECACRDDMHSQTLEIAGVDTTSQRDLHDRISRLIDKRPILLPLPRTLALAGSFALQRLGFDPPVWRDQLQMVEDGNVLSDASTNALRDVLGIEPRSLQRGLREIAHDTPEQFPDDGNGTVMRRRFWVDIADSELTPAQLIVLLRREFAVLMPQSLVDVGTEEVSETELSAGAMISLALPVRGHVQVRVEEVTRYSVTCVTLDGHPLAGVVRFLAETRGDVVRFEVQTIDRPRNALDRIVMALLGTHLKRVTWLTLLRNVAERSGGRLADGPRVQAEPLDNEKQERVQRWVHELVARRLENAELLKAPSVPH
jgi:NADH dehydrogenase